MANMGISSYANSYLSNITSIFSRINDTNDKTQKIGRKLSFMMYTFINLEYDAKDKTQAFLMTHTFVIETTR